MARYIGPCILEFVEETLGSLGLALNRDKTSIVNLNRIGSSLDFLGFTLKGYKCDSSK
jgi:hypothetical protein